MNGARQLFRLWIIATAGYILVASAQALVGAKDSVERQLAKWAEQTGLAVKPPSNIAEAVVQSEIRAHLAAMKGTKIGFLEKYATDPRVASAVLGAPPFLSGLSDTDVAFVQTRVEQHVAPEPPRPGMPR
jgi:hypothetical protein